MPAEASTATRPEPAHSRLAGLAGSRWVRVSLVLGIMVLGAFVRLDPLFDWRSAPGDYFFQGQPLERSVDGYRILTHARDLTDGTYEGIDRRRRVPDSVERPWPPMLAAVVAAALHQWTGLGWTWIAGLLPVLLGPLVALPLYGLGRHYGGTAMGLSSALLGTLALAYVARTGFAWFDTDCLNVTFLLSTAYLALRFGTGSGPRRYVYLAAFAVVTGLFVWWWWPIRGIALAMSVVPLGVALLFHFRPGRREALIFYSLLAGAGLAVAVGLEGALGRVVESMRFFLGYILQENIRADLPAHGAVNAEQMRAPFEVMALWSAGGVFGFVLGWAGVAWLHWRRWPDALYLSALTAVSLLGVFSAVRFLLFLSVLLALGIGFALSEAWRLRNRAPWAALIPFVVIPLVLWPQIATNRKAFPKVHLSPTAVEALATTGRGLPPDAVIWAGWSHGNTLLFWSDRGTVADGDFHDPEVMIYNHLPLTADVDRLAANFMRFFSTRGLPGTRRWTKANGGDRQGAHARLQRLLARGPAWTERELARNPVAANGDLDSAKEWTRFLFPTETRPLYLFLEPSSAQGLRGWWRIGTWDFKKAAGGQASYRPLFEPDTDLSSLAVRREGVAVLSQGPEGLQVDLDRGIARLGDQEIGLSHLVFLQNGRTEVERYRRPNGYRLEVNLDTGVGALADKRAAGSLFNRLFLREAESSYFTPVDLGAPEYQIWEVRGDRP